MASLGLLLLLLASPMLAMPWLDQPSAQPKTEPLTLAHMVLERHAPPTPLLTSPSARLKALGDPMAPEGCTSRRLGPAKQVVPAAPRPAPRAAGADPYRLPLHLKPFSYEITLTPNFTTFTFDGSVDIKFSCEKATDTIVLNVKDLKIDLADVKLYLTSGYTYTSVTAIQEDKLHEMLTIKLAKSMEEGAHYIISIDYVGNLNGEMTGFYRSSYLVGTERRWLGVTQFESTGARRAFPSFDEPSFKARFTVKIRREAHLTSISNMPLEKSTLLPNGLYEDKFDATLEMSTYLLAFLVSDFKKKTNINGNFSVWAREDFITSGGGDFSQEIGPQALKLLEEYTSIPFALPKVDQVAVPDFAAGAMENWGLVTYREQYLIEQEDTTTRIKQFIATTISHELGHQWTGNLVTMDWWSNTWLNEGFATYFEFHITNLIKPEWELMDQFLSGDLHVGFDNDALENQHAMSSDVSSPTEISGKFDRISYAKGGSVLRMFENMLTLPVFKKALSRYLNINTYKNANPDHLFDAMNYEAKMAGKLPSGVTFHQIGSSWTAQAGAPVVKVERDYTFNRVSFRQERFFLSPPTDKELLNTRWWIPLRWVTKSKPDTNTFEPKEWLRGDTVDEVLTRPSGATASEWILLNPSQTGYYRVNYDLRNWMLLSKALVADHTAFSPASRAMLLNDALSLANGGQLDYATALQITQYLAKETNLGPWQAAISSLNFLEGELVTTELYPIYQKYMAAQTAKAYRKVGFTVNPTDAHVDRMLRSVIASWACNYGNEACLADASAALRAWITDTNNLPHIDVRPTALCAGVRGSDRDTFDALKAMWLNEKDEVQRFTILSALACTTDTEVLSNLLSGVVTVGSGVPGSELVNVLNAVANRPRHRFMLLKFAMNNIGKINSNVGDSTTSITVVASLITLGVRTREQYQEVYDWIAENYDKLGKPVKLLEALQTADNRLKMWHDVYYGEVADWMYAATDTNAPEVPDPTTTSPAPTTKSTTTTTTTTKAPSTGPNGAGDTVVNVPLVLLTLFFFLWR